MIYICAKVITHITASDIFQALTGQARFDNNLPYGCFSKKKRVERSIEPTILQLEAPGRSRNNNRVMGVLISVGFESEDLEKNSHVSRAPRCKNPEPYLSIAPPSVPLFPLRPTANPKPYLAIPPKPYIHITFSAYNL